MGIIGRILGLAIGFWIVTPLLSTIVGAMYLSGIIGEQITGILILGTLPISLIMGWMIGGRIKI